MPMSLRRIFPAGLDRRTRLLVSLASVTVAVMALLVAVQSPHGSDATARTLRAGSPLNIVLILTDDQTAESVSHMPYLSSRTDWIRFTAAFDNVSLCCPTRATLLTGQYDTSTGVLSNEGAHSGVAFADSTALPVWLAKAGYTNALVGKYLNHYPFGRAAYTPPGWTEWDAFTGAAAYYNYRIDRNGVVEPHASAPADYSTDVFTGIANSFLTTAKPPFFLHYSPHAPHSPYVASPSHQDYSLSAPVAHDQSFNEADVSDKPAFIRALGLQDAAQVDADRRTAWAMGLSVDDAIRTFDETLAARGLLDTTLEIFMTDNGYAFGEHRWLHKRCEYDICMRIPLMIRAPGHAGRRINRLVSTVDIAPTIADAAGVRPAVRPDGRSLLPLLDGTPGPWRDNLLEHWGGGGPVVLGNPPDFCAVRTDRYRYVRLVTGETELYDDRLDAAELTNEAANPAYSSVVAAMTSKLDAYRAAGACDELAPAGQNATYAEEP